MRLVKVKEKVSISAAPRSPPAEGRRRSAHRRRGATRNEQADNDRRQRRKEVRAMAIQADLKAGLKAERVN